MCKEKIPYKLELLVSQLWSWGNGNPFKCSYKILKISIFQMDLKSTTLSSNISSTFENSKR